DLDTGLIERCRDELFPRETGAGDEDLAAAALAELAAEEAQAAERAKSSGDPHSPWHRVDGWRLNLGSHHEFVFAEGERRHPVAVHFTASGLRLSVDGREYALAGGMEGGVLHVRLDGKSFRARAVRDGTDWHVFRDGAHRTLALHEEHAAPDADASSGSLAAPMPGKVIEVLVRPGTRVAKGAPLMVLEAMKMEHTIAAPHEGVVKEIHFRAGEQVSEGAELLKLEAA
ncbi:MAG: acetyl-CoA carboxylase biotin carboxyl carrier protein subunit, partial [Burkholderiales bacterium]